MAQITPLLTRQQFCAALNISESTVRRLESVGMPCTPVGVRKKLYDLEECKAWLRVNQARLTASRQQVAEMRELDAKAREFVETARKMKLRVYPSRKP